jgi:carbon storage regulator
MLILNRKPGEAVVIDGDIRVVILASDAGGVRVGIEAPSHVGILRAELVERVREETRAAGAGDEARRFLERVAAAKEGAEPSEEASGDAEDEPEPPPAED